MFKLEGQWLLLGWILFLGMVLRLTGLNWDQGNHLHPDERFLTMVAVALRLPNSVGEYLNAELSTLNPRNMGYEFFVYGAWPVTLVKLAAVAAGRDSYEQLTLLGRAMSAWVDMGTLLVTYGISRLLTKRYKLAKSFPLWTTLIYALMVLPIQLSHFMAADIWLTLFLTLSWFMALKFGGKPGLATAIGAGLAWGMALATKLNAAVVLPLIIGTMWLLPIIELKQKSGRQIGRLLGLTGLFLVSGYLTLRITDPTIFASPNWLKPIINPDFIANIKELKRWEKPDVWFPPAVQWLTKAPVWFAFKNMTLLGVGVVTMFLMIIGIGRAGQLMIKNQGRIVWLLILGFVLAVFLYQSTQFVKALRYFIYLYPMLAILAGLGASNLSQRRRWVTPALVVALLIWPLMMLSIYVKPHSRVQASRWIIDNIPEQSVLLSELWDDGLPVAVPGVPPKEYRGEQLPVFDPDTSEKWQIMEAKLRAGDYYLLTSNRGWGSISTVPDRFPQMSRFYEDLLAGRLPYQKVAEFTSYPSLNYLGIPLTLPDDWADETFTVYDHPKVMIYKLK